MSLHRAALLTLMLLAGCAAEMPQQPLPGSGTVTSTGAAAAGLAAERRSLTHIGLRDCDGYRLDIYAPARLTAASQSQGNIYLRASAYRAGGGIRVALPAGAARLQRQTGAGWQDLPLQAAGGAASASLSASGGVAATGIAQQLGQSSPLPAGQYRLWSGRFSGQRAGAASCSLSPLWQFTVE